MLIVQKSEGHFIHVQTQPEGGSMERPVKGYNVAKWRASQVSCPLGAFLMDCLRERIPPLVFEEGHPW